MSSHLAQERVAPKRKKPSKIKQLLEAEKAESRLQTTLVTTPDKLDSPAYALLNGLDPALVGLHDADVDNTPTALTPALRSSAATPAATLEATPDSGPPAGLDESAGLGYAPVSDVSDEEERGLELEVRPSTAPSNASSPDKIDNDDNVVPDHRPADDNGDKTDTTSVSSTRSSRSASFNPDAMSFIPDSGALTSPSVPYSAPTSYVDGQYGEATYPGYASDPLMMAAQGGASVGNFMTNEYLSVPDYTVVMQAVHPILPVYHSPSPEFRSRQNSFSSTGSHHSSRSSSFSGSFSRSRHSSFNGSLPPRPATAPQPSSPARPPPTPVNTSEFFPVTCPELHTLKFRE